MDKNIFEKKAVAAYRQGLGIIPLEPGKKVPYNDLLPKTKNGAGIWTPFKTQRATPGQVAAWVSQCPHANYGIVGDLPSTIDGSYLYVLDVEDRGRFEEMLREIVTLYGETQSVLSRRGGHIYLLSSAPVQTRNRYRDELQFEIKGQSAYVVGEGCGHPEGGWYEIHSSPGRFALVDNIPFCDLEFVPAEELRANNGNFVYHIATQKHRQALQGHFRDVSKNYDRSRVMQSIVTTCRNRDIDKGIVQRVLENIDLGVDPLGAKYLTHYQAQLQEHGERTAQRAFRRAWDYAGQRPLTLEATATIEQMNQLFAWVEAQPWKGQGGLIMRDVLLAHIRRCRDACQPIYHLDVRSGAEMAQCHHMTFKLKTALLRTDGFLRLVEPFKGQKPNSYELQVDKFYIDKFYKNALAKYFFQCDTLSSSLHGSPCIKVEESSNKEPFNDNNSNEAPLALEQRTLEQRTLEQCPSEQSTLELLTASDRYHGVFERGGLGRGAERVWRCLRGQILSPKDIGLKTGHKSGSVSRYLSRLRESGLVTKKGRLYSGVEHPDFLKISRQLDTHNKAFRRHMRHYRQRAEFQARQNYKSSAAAADKTDT